MAIWNFMVVFRCINCTFINMKCTEFSVNSYYIHTLFSLCEKAEERCTKCSHQCAKYCCERHLEYCINFIKKNIVLCKSAKYRFVKACSTLPRLGYGLIYIHIRLAIGSASFVSTSPSLGMTSVLALAITQKIPPARFAGKSKHKKIWFKVPKWPLWLKADCPWKKLAQKKIWFVG